MGNVVDLLNRRNNRNKDANINYDNLPPVTSVLKDTYDDKELDKCLFCTTDADSAIILSVALIHLEEFKDVHYFKTSTGVGRKGLFTLLIPIYKEGIVKRVNMNEPLLVNDFLIKSCIKELIDRGILHINN